MVDTNASLFLALPRKILILVQAWLWFQNSLLSKIFMMILVLMQYLFLACEIVIIVQSWGDLDAVSESSFLFCTQFSVCVKTFIFLNSQKSLVSLVNTMNSEVFVSENKSILQSRSEKIMKLNLFLLTTVTTTTVLWILMPLFDNTNGIRSFPFKVWMPVSETSSPGYELGYLSQVISISVGAAYYFSVDVLVLCMIMFGSAQLEVVMWRLEQVKAVPVIMENTNLRDEIIKENNDIIIECIRRQQAVVGFIKDVENAFHFHIFVQIMGTVGLICVAGFRATIISFKSVQFFSMITFMLTMITQLYLFCWAGNGITSKSEKIRDCLYLSPWYDQDRRYQRIMVIAMECMKRNIVIKAGHIVPLCWPTFVSILRASYSYFAVLSSSYSNENTP